MATSKRWRPVYDEAVKELKVAARAQGMKIALQGKHEHLFVLGTSEAAEPCILHIRLSRSSGWWYLDAGVHETLKDAFPTYAIFLKDQTRGFVLGPRQLERQQWAKNISGKLYRIGPRDLRGCPSFSSAEECMSRLGDILSQGR